MWPSLSIVQTCASRRVINPDCIAVSSPRFRYCTQTHGEFSLQVQQFRNPSRHYFAILNVFVDDRLYTTNTDDSSVEISRTFILQTSKMSRSTQRMLSGVKLIHGPRSCGSLSPMSRPSLIALEHLNSSSPTRALIAELISQKQKKTVFLKRLPKVRNNPRWVWKITIDTTLCNGRRYLSFTLGRRAKTTLRCS